MARALFLIHLLGFAAYLGFAYAQLEFMKRSRNAGMPAAVRDEYERLAAAALTRGEVPALFVQIASGVVTLVLAPEWLKQGWLHAKLTSVLLLVVLSHLEMFNARAIVKARKERGDAASAEIDARKVRHLRFGTVGSVLVVALLMAVVLGLR